MKNQSSIISTIILSGIILAIVSATFIWGQPLVQKSTDKIKVNTIINNLKTIDDKIVYTQQTGSSSVVSLNIDGATYRISPNDNSIIVKTETLIPIITSYSFIPIGYSELAYEPELISINTSNTNQSIISGPSKYYGEIKFGNKSINGVNYNFSVYNTSDKYDYLCMFNGSDINSTDSDCAEELNSITKNGIKYTIAFISYDGKEVVLSGSFIENIGLLGSDPSGIISGKNLPTRDKQFVTLKLSYRGLKDANNNYYKIILECDANCLTSNSKKLIITRDRIERTSNATYYYIRLHFN